MSGPGNQERRGGFNHPREDFLKSGSIDIRLLKVQQKNGLEWKPTFALTHAKLPSLLLVSAWMPTSNRPADNPVKSLFPEHLAPDYCDLILLFTLLTKAQILDINNNRLNEVKSTRACRRTFRLE